MERSNFVKRISKKKFCRAHPDWKSTHQGNAKRKKTIYKQYFLPESINEKRCELDQNNA
ncbi:hypothetical protein [Pararhizobium qamdonense]|uniref:hypothetical protein n=1 Tax=Pararhizobium qamdonense TaxID=3031126 RepID=UPI0023E18EEB|nr:hypothetical protein [Pararhizobium qamdonense]